MRRIGPALDSPSIGTAVGDLIEACEQRKPRPAVPPPVEGAPAIAVALSGGGFRATLAGLGVLRFLADANLLGRVRYLSSVSGGSLANAIAATSWNELAVSGFSRSAYDTAVVRKLLNRICRKSLTAALIRNAWRTLGPRTRTDVLAMLFDDWFLDEQLLEDLPEGVRFVFNAANVTTGVRFGFERDVVGDWVMGRVETRGSGLRVSQAAAASAAVPGAFAPMKVDLDFPCAKGRVAMVLDGGTYDNLGLEAIDDLRDACLIALNAGGLFQTGTWSAVPFVGDLARSSALLYRQTNTLRMRTMVERFQAWEQARDAGAEPPPWGRQGVLFGLATVMGDQATAEWTDKRAEPTGEEISQLALTATSFGKFDVSLCEALIYRGWWLTGATLATYHRELLGELPVWTPLDSLG